HWRLDPKLVWSIISVAGPAIIQFLVTTATWSVLVTIVAAFGSVAIAGYQIGMRVFLFLLLPIVGLANAAATLVGQNRGAKTPQRAECSVWIAGGWAAGILGVLGLAFILFSTAIGH